MTYRPRALAGIFAAALMAVACGGDDANDAAPGGDDPSSTTAADIPDGPAITLTSFNFPESEILAEAYAQALEGAGYPVERQLNLGARELVFPQLEDGNVDLLPEYLGSAIMAGFGEDAPEDLDSGLETLRGAMADLGVTVLDAAPAQNANTFVTTTEFADEHGLSSVADLAHAGPIVFAGPPECEERTTCFAGLTEVYGLDEITFTSIQEASARLSALDAGDAQLILLFSTDAPLAGDELVALEDTAGMIPPENVVPVVRSEVLDIYGDDLQAVLDEVTAAISTEALQQMNASASEGRSPADIAESWLSDNGLL